MNNRRDIDRRRFPLLDDKNHGVTSDRDGRYNCVAWALNDTESKWWPDEDYVWFPGAPREDSVAAFIAGFQSVGYERCESPEFEDGWEKLTIYATTLGSPMHVARQLPDGRWTSKLGIEGEDIWHASVNDLVAAGYGNPVVFLRRRRSRT